MKILVTGATGNTAQKLIAQLSTDALHSIVAVSRTQIAGSHVIGLTWQDIDNGNIEGLKNIDVVIHLAGQSIASVSWNRRGRNTIVESRVNTAQKLFNAFQSLKAFPPLYISASAVGYYGISTDSAHVDESHPAGSDFLAGVCVQWEQVADAFKAQGSRVVIMRLGTILSHDAGIFSVFHKLSKFRMLAVMGSGKQYLPWIHESDVLAFLNRALVNQSFTGTYNLVSPHLITQHDFIRTLLRLTNRKSFMPRIPQALLRLFLGEKSIIITHGLPVVPCALIESGSEFLFPEIKAAMASLLYQN